MKYVVLMIAVRAQSESEGDHFFMSDHLPDVEYYYSSGALSVLWARLTGTVHQRKRQLEDSIRVTRFLYETGQGHYLPCDHTR